jgi:protein-tyrosine-phosphatase
MATLPAVKLKHLVPARLRRWRQVLASLNPEERQALFGAAVSVTLHPRRRDWRPAVRNAADVVFVCHGNIIRSPLAAAAFAREAASRARTVQVSSAGLSARAGEPADPRAADSAEERGLPLESHRARPLDAAQVTKAGAIFVMDHLNLGRILARFPDAADRVFLLGGCQPDGRMTLTEIHDPVSGTLDDVRVAHDEVIAAVRVLATAWDEPPR